MSNACFSVLGCGVLLTISVGCAALQPPSTDISSQLPDSRPVVMVYKVGGNPAGNRPVTQAAPNIAESNVYVLSLKYPHPRCKPGFARVELVVQSAPVHSPSHDSLSRRAARALESFTPGMRMGDGVEAAWMLEVPRKDIDQALGQLAEQSFFAAGNPAASDGAMLAVEASGQMTAKHWRRVDALDQLVARTRRKGKLVSHTGAALDLTALIETPPAQSVVPVSFIMPTPGAAPISAPPEAQIERLPAVQP